MPNLREDLYPGTEKHRIVQKLIRDRVDFAYRSLSRNFPIWDQAEESYQTYRPLDDEDRESEEKHGVRKIIVPIQFAAIQTICTFLCEIFTAIKPVLRVKGADPASVRPAKVMELLLDHDYRNNRGYLMLHQWFLTACRYGYGVMENTWGQRQITKLRWGVDPSAKGARMTLPEGIEIEVPPGPELSKQYFTTFEGNHWKLIDPRGFLFDPRVPLTEFQKGEFCGCRTLVHDNELRKLDDQGIFFNVSRIKTDASRGPMGGGSVMYPDPLDPGARGSRGGRMYAPEMAFSGMIADAKKNRMHVNEQLIVELIPKDYDLSDTDQPESWIFNLIDGTTICRAEPNPFYGFPYAVIESYPDVITYVTQGVMELTEPLAAHMSFLVNSHLQNVRKAINDMLIVDPSRIDLRDLLDPKAGKVIRMLPMAYGQDPSLAVRQLNVQDITQTHLQDLKVLMELWHRVLGTSETMFGQVSMSRRTATDVSAALKSASSRMKTMADLMAAEGVAPLTEMMALTRQDNTTIEQFIELAGRSASEIGVSPDQIIEGWAKITKDHLVGNFFYPAEEGVLPTDRAQAAEIMMKVFEAVARFPFLQQVFDPVEVFKEVARQYGMWNISDFLQRGVVSAQVASPEQMATAGGGYMPMGTAPPPGVPYGQAPGGAPPGPVPSAANADQEGLSLAGMINGSGRAIR